jgi:hypothetical protein
LSLEPVPLLDEPVGVEPREDVEVEERLEVLRRELGLHERLDPALEELALRARNLAGQSLGSPVESLEVDLEVLRDSGIESDPR